MGPSAPNGPPVPDSDCRGDGLQNRYSWSNPAAIEQHRLHGLRDAVPLIFDVPYLAMTPNKAADNRSHDGPFPTQMVCCALTKSADQRWKKKQW